MRTANRFAIAVHVLSILGQELGGDSSPESPDRPGSSEWIAGSVGVNPVVVRNVIGMLRRAGLVATRRGVSGARITRPLGQITLLDVYRAVEDDGAVFSIHPRPNPKCPIGASIQGTLEKVFGEAQAAMESRLAGVTMDEVLHELQRTPDHSSVL